MINNQLIFFILFFIFLGGSCTNAEVNTDKQKIKQEAQEQETVYNGEYIKIIDKEAEKNRPKRAINDYAPVRLGDIKIKVGENEKEINTFKKGKTDMHITEKGIIMRIADMQQLSLNITINNKDIFNKAVQSYRPQKEERENLTAKVTYKDVVNNQPARINWSGGKLQLTSFSPGLGAVELKLTGTGTDESSGETVPLEIELSMNFEEIHSSIRPKV